MINLSKGKKLTLDSFKRLLFETGIIEIEGPVIQEVKNCFKFLQDYASDKIIYGINTGLGPMAQYKIDNDKTKELQLNLIRSHAAGVGEIIDDESVRASLLVRLNCLCKANSGVHTSVLETLKQIINHNIIPYIPQHGGVGASGDLVQLSHLALVLIGEGKVKYKGEWQKTGEVFKKLNISPIEIHIREGLALINGTSVMTGIGLNNIIHARSLVNHALIASALINEIVCSFNDHFSHELNRLKIHGGQNKVAKAMRDVLVSSKRITNRHDELYSNGENGSFKIDKKVQEYYSLRCVPQILGPILDTLQYTEEILLEEANSVNDNPVIDHENENVFHGGNFHGDYVSFEMDKLKLSITKLSMLIERQLNFTVNHRLNKILPPFGNLGTLGLNLGMQGAQFTAVSTTAENQALSNSMYVHSIPNNNDNQDIVSMGTNSALLCKKVIDNTYQVMAIQFMMLAQAVDYLDISSKLSETTQAVYKEIRGIFPAFKEDYPVYTDIEKVISYLKDKQHNHPELL